MYQAALPLLLAYAGSVSAALEVDFNSIASIKSAAKDVAFDAMSYYKGNQSGETPGIFGLPPRREGDEFYWANGATLWSAMLDYWRYTGDETYNTVATTGLVHQSDPGQQYPFMSPNWTAGLTNFGHGGWGLSAMPAAELEFPNPPGGGASWIELAKGVFRALEARYAAETDTCGGGLRVPIPPVNRGYNLKGAGGNAAFLNLGARLARYTGNQTYAEWADKTWDWFSTVGLIEENDDSITVLDAVSASNCSDVRRNLWTGSTGILLEGAAYMYNQSTGAAQTLWHNRISKMTSTALSWSFPLAANNQHILVEPICEKVLNPCNPQGWYQKGVYLRALANTAQLAPFTAADIARRVRDSAVAAAKTCDSGVNGRECAYVWDGDANWERRRGKRAVLDGPSEALNALSVLLGLLVDEPGRKGFAMNRTVESGGGEGPEGDDGGGSGQGESQGDGDGGSAGTTTRVAVGWMVVGLVAALF